MADLINLNKVRKRAQREQHAKKAEQNRVLHGRSKAEQQLDEARQEKAARLLDAHRLNDGEAG